MLASATGYPGGDVVVAGGVPGGVIPGGDIPGPAEGVVPPGMPAIPAVEEVELAFSLNESKNVLTSGESLVIELLLRAITTSNLEFTI